MKKHPVVFAGLCLVIIAVIGAVFVLPSIAGNRYWEDAHLQNAVLDLSKYSEQIAGGDSDLDEIEAVVHRCNEAAVPVRSELSPFFEACNRMITDYFRDIYEIDVSDKMQMLQIMEATYPESVSEMVGGSYSGDFPEKLFVNADVLENLLSDTEGGALPEVTDTAFSAKLLRTVYIHEVMHYLGFNSDMGFDHLMEAVAESLNKEVMLHGNIKYESITGYASIQGFAAQIMKCDTEFVREVLTGSNPDMGAYFNSRLGGGSDTNYAEYFDKLIGLIREGDSGDIGRLEYYAQYLTYEYCKAINSDARSILASSKEKAVGMFEIRWFLGIE